MVMMIIIGGDGGRGGGRLEEGGPRWAEIGVNRELWDRQQHLYHQVGRDWREQRALGSSTTSTREEVPPILLFLVEKQTGDWVSQSSRPVAPGRGLEGGRRSGLTPPRSFL